MQINETELFLPPVLAESKIAKFDKRTAATHEHNIFHAYMNLRSPILSIPARTPTNVADLSNIVDLCSIETFTALSELNASFLAETSLMPRMMCSAINQLADSLSEINPFLTFLTETSLSAPHYISTSQTIASAIFPEISATEMERQLQRKTAAKFANLEKVRSVYFQKYRKEFHFFILVEMQRYDEELMDSLLDREIAIRDTFPELVLQFFYPPVSPTSKSDFVHPSALCVYAKE